MSSASRKSKVGTRSRTRGKAPALADVGNETLQRALSGDGRRRRSERSHERIVNAMFDLLRSGEMHPSAAAVAKKAGVGLRSVFRHFQDMDAIYRAMNDKLELEIVPMLATPYVATGWKGRIREMVQRRARMYERMLPLKVAGELRRYQSPFLMQSHERFVAMELRTLKNILPARLQENPVRIAALEMATGFHAWRHLRDDQGMPPEQAAAAITLAVERILGLDGADSAGRRSRRPG